VHRRSRPEALGALAALLLLGQGAELLAREADRARDPAPLQPGAVKPGQRSLLQRLRPFKKTTIILTAGLSAGPFIGGVSSSVGLVIRARDSELPQGLFWQNGADLLVLGARRISSPVPELRGWEWNIGPRSQRHPIYGDRVGLAIIPDVLSIAASRSGGLGIGFSLPIPGVPFALCRAPFSIYVASPGLCRIGGKVNDGIDALTRIGARLAAPILRPAKRLLRPITDPTARAARRIVTRVSSHRQESPSLPVP
jgi:hypothetical protein